MIYYRKHYCVDFFYNRDLLTDDVYMQNDFTQLRVYGNSRDVRTVNECIHREMQALKMKTLSLQMNDGKLILDSIKEVKISAHPCEVRVKKMTRDQKELRHPFYYLPVYVRDLVLIGYQKEIDAAELKIEKALSEKRKLQKVNMHQVSYLLPTQIRM